MREMRRERDIRRERNEKREMRRERSVEEGERGGRERESVGEMILRDR
jgi:hypothetical protein